MKNHCQINVSNRFRKCIELFKKSFEEQTNINLSHTQITDAIVKILTNKPIIIDLNSKGILNKKIIITISENSIDTLLGL